MKSISRATPLTLPKAGPLAAEFVVSPIVVELATGRAAIDLLKTSVFDLIVADLTALGDIAEGAANRIGKLARAAAGKGGR